MKKAGLYIRVSTPQQEKRRILNRSANRKTKRLCTSKRLYSVQNLYRRSLFWR